MTPRLKFKTNEEEVAEVAVKAAARKNPILRAAMQAVEHDRGKQDCPDLSSIQSVGASLVNYAAAPLGGQTYDSNWLATNTTAR